VVPHGLGKYIWVAKLDATTVWAKGLFIAEICYTVIITTIKYSILLFCWRIFKASKNIRIPIYILWGMVTRWGIAVVSLMRNAQMFKWDN